MNKIALSTVSALLFALTACQAGENNSTPPDETQQNNNPATTEVVTNGNVLKTGNFQAGEYSTSGVVTIIEADGKKYIEISEDFKTDTGPDLFVILHKQADLIQNTEAPTHSIQEGDYLNIAPLQKVAGKQQYEIPADLNLDEYNTVAIWCRKFNTTFGAATLN